MAYLIRCEVHKPIYKPIHINHFIYSLLNIFLQICVFPSNWLLKKTEINCD